MLIETGLSMIAVNLPVLYRSVAHEGVESVIKQVRSFASLRSLRSQLSERGSSSSRKQKQSQDMAAVPAIYGVQDSSISGAARSSTLPAHALEEGNILVTNTIDMDSKEQSVTEENNKSWNP
jgi:hypothetical protein